MPGFDDSRLQKSPQSPRSPGGGVSGSGAGGGGGSGGETSEKSKRYDRQLRLWGEHGQTCIERSHVCLINATATGTEILKSLVLPGVGAFTVADGGKVTGEDVGNNFFLDKESIGSSRAKVTTQLLLEMNPEVRGDFVEESLESLLDANPQFFANFSVVFATGVINEKSLQKLAQMLWEENVPLLVCKALGFIGYIRLQVKEHPVIESHPDTVLEDLRLDAPFTELKSYLKAKDALEKLTRKDLAHTPFLTILYKYLEKWRTEAGRPEKSLPENYKEKELLRKTIRHGIEELRASLRAKESDHEEAKEIDLENFEEAIKAVNNILVYSNWVPTETKQILEDPKVEEPIGPKTVNTRFWLLVKALKEFMSSKNNGCLPVRGTIPDMTADSGPYVELQKIFSAKAKEDKDSFHSSLQTVCNSVGKSVELFSENEIRVFCKNAHALRLVRTSPISAEYAPFLHPEPGMTKLKEIISSIDLTTESDTDLIFYLMLRAVDRFFTLYNRCPGYCSDQVESDVLALRSSFKEILAELNCGPLSKEDFVLEMCRYGGCELHSVAAFIGGCAAHEVVKLITGQYVPLNNTLIYNAMTSTTATFEL